MLKAAFVLSLYILTTRASSLNAVLLCPNNACAQIDTETGYYYCPDTFIPFDDPVVNDGSGASDSIPLPEPDAQDDFAQCLIDLGARDFGYSAAFTADGTCTVFQNQDQIVAQYDAGTVDLSNCAYYSPGSLFVIFGLPLAQDPTCGTATGNPCSLSSSTTTTSDSSSTSTGTASTTSTTTTTTATSSTTSTTTSVRFCRPRNQ